MSSSNSSLEIVPKQMVESVSTYRIFGLPDDFINSLSIFCIYRKIPLFQAIILHIFRHNLLQDIIVDRIIVLPFFPFKQIEACVVTEFARKRRIGSCFISTSFRTYSCGMRCLSKEVNSPKIRPIWLLQVCNQFFSFNTYEPA